MTSGEIAGTSGGGAFWRSTPWLVCVGVGLVVVLVNATSGILEDGRDGPDIHPAEPFLWEFSSYIVVLTLAPWVGRAMRLWPPRLDALPQFALIHAGLTLPFSMIHIAVMVAIREAAYWLVNARYGFFDDGVAITLLYEWRKDVLTYAAVAAVYWTFRPRPRAPPAPPDPDARIEIRDGASAVFLAPGDIFSVEAAGNYVEVHTAQRTHLVRATLAAYAARLAPHGFVRVHRARLVNRARIRAMKPTPSGDVELTLDDGRTLMASRRYRAELEGVARLT